MNLELYDCPRCGTQGVLLTAEGACPNCRYPFSEQERRKPSTRIVAASPPSLTSPGRDNPCEEAISSWRTVQDEMRRRRWSVGLTLGGMAGLFLSPVVLWGLGTLYGGHFGEFSPRNMDKVTIWTAVSFFGGWILFEAGMALSHARWVVQILVRLPVYLFVLLMLLVFGLIALFSMFPMGP
jgi:hypothetical protein